MLIALRLARVAVHLLIGFDTAFALGRLPENARRAFVRWWARGLLSALGVRLRITGKAVERPALLVANHVSWLDVIAIVAADPALFVCKSEVASWPGIGWLVKRAGTLFIRRGSFRDVWRLNTALRARFEARQSVAVFPEGTTTLGHEMLVFRPALFQPALERGIPIQPVAIAYSSVGAAYVGEMSFARSLLSICAARSLEVRVTMLAALPCGLTRRQAAATARRLIGARLAQAPFAEDYASSPLRYAAAPFACTSQATPGSVSPRGLRGPPDK